MMVEWPHHSRFWRELLESAKDVGIATLVIVRLERGGGPDFSLSMTARRFPPPWSIDELEVLCLMSKAQIWILLGIIAAGVCGGL
jgi:hypothetical protein